MMADDAARQPRRRFKLLTGVVAQLDRAIQ
jgi:hypothetical protein